MPRLLIIEDDETICKALVEAAQNAGWIPECVPGREIRKGQAADIALANKRCDAIVVGGYFPEAEVQLGHTIVGQIRKFNRTVIIIGTAGNPKRELDFLNAGANAFVCRGSMPTANPAGGFTEAQAMFDRRFQVETHPPKTITPNTTPDQL